MSGVGRGNLAMLVLIALAGVVYPIFSSSSYTLGQVIEILFFAGLCSAWNIVGGMAGQFAFSHSIYIAAGAYAAALCAGNGVSPFLGLVAGCVIAMLLGVAIAWVSSRFELPPLAFALITLAFSEIGLLFVLASDWLGGPSGYSIPFGGGSDIWMFQFSSYTGYYYVILALAVLCLAVSIGLYGTKTGLYYRCVRDNERAAAAIGISALRVKLHSMAISAGLTSLMGGAYGMYVGFVDPHKLASPEIIIQVILFAAVGGMGTVWGPVIGAALLVPVGEVLRVRFGAALPPGAHVFIYGTALVLVLLLAREGLVEAARALLRRLRAPGEDAAPSRPSTASFT